MVRLRSFARAASCDRDAELPHQGDAFVPRSLNPNPADVNVVEGGSCAESEEQGEKEVKACSDVR